MIQFNVHQFDGTCSKFLKKSNCDMADMAGTPKSVKKTLHDQHAQRTSESRKIEKKHRERQNIFSECEKQSNLSVYHLKLRRECRHSRKSEEWSFCTNCTGDTKLAATALDVISAYYCCFVTVFRYLVMCDLLDLLFYLPLDPI